MSASTRRSVLVFDVNETLLDLEALSPHFARIFGDPAAMRDWFNGVVLHSQSLTLAGEYADFSAVGAAVLRMLGAIRGVPVADDDVASIRNTMRALPPHPDVAPALHRLRDAGFRLVTLTNNPTVVCEAQLAAAGLRDLFERLFSVDEGPRRYKPAPESYAAVADALDLPPGELCLVACHTWDTLGAAAAGLRTALLLRPGNAPLALGRAPDFVATDLAVLADQLIATVS